MYGDVTEYDDDCNSETEIRSEFFVPFGDFGIFVAASTVPDDIEETDVTLAKVLVANAQAALDRVWSA